MYKFDGNISGMFAPIEWHLQIGGYKTAFSRIAFDAHQELKYQKRMEIWHQEMDKFKSQTGRAYLEGANETWFWS